MNNKIKWYNIKRIKSVNKAIFLFFKWYMTKLECKIGCRQDPWADSLPAFASSL